MKKIRYLFILLLTAAFLLSCAKKENKDTIPNNSVVNITPANSITGSKAPDDTTKTKADTGNTATDISPTNIPAEKTAATEPVIVDSYDITASVTGTPLKDAYKDYFKIGVGLNGSSLDTATVRSAAMSEIIKYHFNSVTYSNLMKPSYLLDQNGSINNYKNRKSEPALNFDSVVEGLEFCKANNIKMRGHVLVWHNQVPDWFFRKGFQSDGEFVDKDTMLVRLESYIKQVLEFTQTNYPGVIYCWDVVNEAVEISSGSYETVTGFNIRTKFDGSKDNLWYKVIGTDYVEKAFEFARKYAAKEVKLFYNDYNTFQTEKTLKIYALVSYLKDKGFVDGIGMQGYMDLTYPGIFSENDCFMNAISKFAELGLEIQITELTIRSKDKSEASMKKQANRYKMLFQLLTSMDTKNGKKANITSVTVFGLMDEYLFYPGNTEYSRLFDGKLQPKPAFYSILSLMEK